MSRQRALKRLEKLLTYALGHRPDEFGLVLEPDGFVKIKDFLKAVHEEDGLKYVRRSHIEEILVSQPDPLIEIKDNFIRAKYRDKLIQTTLAQNLPKLLYTCVRRRTYPVVFQKGIFPVGHSRVILSSRQELAERIGKRMDMQPVLLTVLTRKSMDAGIAFYTAGEILFTADSIPLDCFTGPPLPPQKPSAIERKNEKENHLQKYPGSYFIDLESTPNRPKALKGKKKDKSGAWKKDLKPSKKQKHRKERPPWRS